MINQYSQRNDVDLSLVSLFVVGGIRRVIVTISLLPVLLLLLLCVVLTCMFISLQQGFHNSSSVVNKDNINPHKVLHRYLFNIPEKAVLPVPFASFFFFRFFFSFLFLFIIIIFVEDGNQRFICVM